MPLAFLHTVRSNVDVFRDLLARQIPGATAPYGLIEDVLRDALATGTVTDAMRAQTAAAIERLVEDGATLIVCTCSTIGEVAEATPVPDDVRVVRIDRAMAERAVASSRRIVVAATLRSTLQPTLALIRQVAARRGLAPAVVEVLCEEAWTLFSRGDRDGYASEIARAVRVVATPADVVVLAQASMAPAAPMLEAQGITTLASPDLGLRAALDALGSGEPLHDTKGPRV